MGIEEYLDNMKGMIDELKTMSADLSLANSPEEYSIISELFTYKFLNDKLMYAFEHRANKKESFQEFIDFADDNTARIDEEYLLVNLFQRQNEEEFPLLFDQAFENISELNKEIYSIETTSGKKKPLLVPLSVILRDEDKEAELAKRSINILNKYTFKGIYERGWDYFSSVFEYLIKDYNKDSGQYGEYYTPASAGKIMAEILYNNTPVKRVSLYDPAAGSGTLLLSMANVIGVNNCTLYSQDRSRKATDFLRINLILNGLAHSLSNVIEGNTMTKPMHLEGDRLQQFDFIVSNPPFNVDFSSDVSTMKTDTYGRFSEGIPNIPKKDVDSMAIYLCFIQHILASLNEKGKAAIVVPTMFLAAGKGIPKKIRKKIIDHGWLRGAVSMPANIFATTGTSVSILFIDKTRNKNENVILVDATGLGSSVTLENGKKTILSQEDETKIINAFLNREEIEDFSIEVSNADIEKKNYSFSAGQYFDVKISYVPITKKEFDDRIAEIVTDLKADFAESKKLESAILKQIGEIALDETKKI